jgi:hypothetical protein
VAIESSEDGDDTVVVIRGTEVIDLGIDDLVYDASITDDGTVVVSTLEGLDVWSDGTLTELAAGDDLDVEVLDHGPDEPPTVFAWTSDGTVYGGRVTAEPLPELGAIDGDNVVTYSQPATDMLIFQQYLPEDDEFVLYSAFADGRLVPMFTAWDPNLLDVTDDGRHAFVMTYDAASDAYGVHAVPTAGSAGGESTRLFRVDGILGNAQWDEVSQRFTYTMYDDFARRNPQTWTVGLDGERPVLRWDGYALLDHANMWSHVAVIRGEEPFGPGKNWAPPDAEPEVIELFPEEDGVDSGPEPERDPRGYDVDGEWFVPPLIPEEEQLTRDELVAVMPTPGDQWVFSESRTFGPNSGYSQGCGPSNFAAWKSTSDPTLFFQVKTRAAVCDWAYDPAIDTSAGEVVDCWKPGECKIHLDRTILTVAVTREDALAELDAFVAALERTEWATIDGSTPGG